MNDDCYRQLSFSDILSRSENAPCVKKITRDDAKPFIMNIHYARRMPTITHAFGLFVGGGVSRRSNLRNTGLSCSV